MGFSEEKAPDYSLSESQGIVTKTISSTCRGRVKYMASYWMAQLQTDGMGAIIEPGEIVEILGRMGNTLLVKSVQDSPEDA